MTCSSLSTSGRMYNDNHKGNRRWITLRNRAGAHSVIYLVSAEQQRDWLTTFCHLTLNNSLNQLKSATITCHFATSAVLLFLNCIWSDGSQSWNVHLTSGIPVESHPLCQFFQVKNRYNFLNSYISCSKLWARHVAVQSWSMVNKICWLAYHILHPSSHSISH